MTKRMRTLGTFKIRLLQIRCFKQLVDERVRIRPGNFNSTEDGITSTVLRFFPTFQCGLSTVQGSSFAETRTAGRISANNYHDYPNKLLSHFFFATSFFISSREHFGIESRNKNQHSVKSESYARGCTNLKGKHTVLNY